MIAKKVLSMLAILGALTVLGLTPGPADAASPLYTPFLISNQEADITHSAVAYNTQDHVYLVVWCHQQVGSTAVFGRTVSERGQLEGVYPISETTNEANRCDPDVAYDSKHNNYLVVWQQQVGASFTVHGKVFAPGTYQSDDLTINDPLSSSNAATPPAVDYDYTSDEFLVVWAHWAGGVNSSILSQRVRYDGLKIGSNFVVAQGQGTVSAYDPDVAYNLARNEFLVVYTRLDTNVPSGPNRDIFGWRVAHDQNGQVKVGSEIQVSYLSPQENHPSVAALPTPGPESGRYLVAYQTTFYDTGGVFIDDDIWGQIVHGNGTLMFPNAYFVIQGTEAYETLPAVAASQDSRNFLVTWTGSDPSHILYSIMARTVNPDSTKLLAYWLGGFFADNSSVAAGRGGDFLAVADDLTLFGNRDLYGMLLGNRVYIPQVKR